MVVGEFVLFNARALVRIVIKRAVVKGGVVEQQGPKF